MPARKDYTPEFKEQAVRFVLEEIGRMCHVARRVSGSRRGCR